MILTDPHTPLAALACCPWKPVKERERETQLQEWQCALMIFAEFSSLRWDVVAYNAVISACEKGWAGPGKRPFSQGWGGKNTVLAAMLEAPHVACCLTQYKSLHAPQHLPTTHLTLT